MPAKSAYAAITALTLVGLALPASVGQAAPRPTPPVARATTASVRTNTARGVIVNVREGQADPKKVAAKAVASAVGTVGATVTSVTDIGGGSYAVALSTELTTNAASAVSAKAAKASGVSSASADRMNYIASSDPVDDPIGEDPTVQWDMFSTGGSSYSIRANQAWAKSEGAGVTIAVLDTGITGHSELDANVVPGYDFITSIKSARDGDGRDSNPNDEGDYYFNSRGVLQDSSWHGTHVSGTIAALKNGTGVVGVAPQAKIEPVRVLGYGGGTESDIIAGMRWAAGIKVAGVPTNPNPAKVINMSLAGSYPCTSAYQKAINDVIAKGVVVVVAAGNDAKDLKNYSPAGCSGVVVVTASSSSGTMAYYSNLGKSSRPATIAAPGGSATSSTDPLDQWIWSTVNDGTTTQGDAYYGGMVGTSQATPHVAGVVALIRAVHPGWGVSNVITALKASYTKFPAAAKCTITKCGVGIVNAQKAVSWLAIIKNTTAPSVAGTFRVGKRVAARTGSWNTTGLTPAFQWLRNGSAITGATATTYKLTKKDKKKRISLKVTVSRALYVTGVATSSSHKVK